MLACAFGCIYLIKAIQAYLSVSSLLNQVDTLENVPENMNKGFLEDIRDIWFLAIQKSLP